jgi:hypothetical protein
MTPDPTIVTRRAIDVPRRGLHTRYLSARHQPLEHTGSLFERSSAQLERATSRLERSGPRLDDATSLL